MVHGDDQGLVLPPRLAPIQVVVVPIWKSDSERAEVLGVVAQVQAMLGDELRVHVDDRDEYSPGWKFNEWELRGVPLRIEIGPRDVKQGQVTLARRDIPGREGKTAEMASGGHRSDEHSGIGGVILHPHAVAENGTTGERRRRIDGEHRDLEVLGA